jgi:hypothetical protein
MVGVTLSPEQIRNAPPEVRRWLEQELLASFGLQQPAAGVEAPRLAAIGEEEAAAVLSLIQGMLPVMNVFFELGREGISVDGGSLTAFRLTDILQHTRLQTVEHVIACLDTISAAARRIRGDAHVAFYGLDNRGHCFISAQTRHSILQVWQQIIAARHIDATRGILPEADVPAFETSGPSAGEPGMAAPAIATSGVPGLPGSVWLAPARMPTGDGADRTAPAVAPGGVLP